MDNTRNLTLHAPNVHTGGGLVLLKTLLIGWPPNDKLTAFLDERAKELLTIPSDVKVVWVAPTLFSRLAAEWTLFRSTKSCSRVLCFHGLPPLLPCKTNTFVFVQNRLLIQGDLSNKFKWKTRIRITAERLWAKAFRHRVACYIVQTPTMQREMLTWLANSKPKQRVAVVPFAAPLPASSVSLHTDPICDFVYVADGEAHKNHHNLLAAWSLLAEEGIRPSLFLTLGERDAELVKHISETSINARLRITNLGQLPHDEVIDLYARAKALIFPSSAESLGLPLIEAKYLGLPILASELDYVRDVCVPVQTFDPQSPFSIARAVKRHLGYSGPQLQLRTAYEFLHEVLTSEKET